VGSHRETQERGQQKGPCDAAGGSCEGSTAPQPTVCLPGPVCMPGPWPLAFALDVHVHGRGERRHPFLHPARFSRAAALGAPWILENLLTSVHALIFHTQAAHGLGTHRRVPRKDVLCP